MNIYTPPHLRRINGVGNSSVGEGTRVNGVGGNSGDNEGIERRCLTSSENLERRCKTEPSASKINRTRRPDQKVYVPRALRSSLPSAVSQTNNQNSTGSSQSAETSPKSTQTTSQVRNNHARNDFSSQNPFPTQSQGNYTQQSDPSSERDFEESCQKPENNEKHVPITSTAIHTTIPSISHTNTNFSKSESNSSESKRSDCFIELVTEESQELGAEQNETLKILNVAQEGAQRNTENTANLKGNYKSSENRASETCTISEIDSQSTNIRADDPDMEVDESKPLSEPSPVDMDTSDMIGQYNRSSDNLTDSDNHVNSFKDNLGLQEDIDVPNNDDCKVSNSKQVLPVSENMDCESNSDTIQCVESNVPELPENPVKLANDDSTEIEENEVCVINTFDIDNEVPNKVRVVETYSNDSGGSVITKLVSESSSSEIVPTTPVNDTISNRE
ncbi:hypothetical protein WDU94_013179 [Cyamophila willieti]